MHRLLQAVSLCEMEIPARANKLKTRDRPRGLNLPTQTRCINECSVKWTLIVLENKYFYCVSARDHNAWTSHEVVKVKSWL